ncbi:MAG: hypothetical protein IJJ33_18695 [Victivallales bacterium]|nr:hypothetical protein [Victivallales bacterium]
MKMPDEKMISPRPLFVRKARKTHSFTLVFLDGYANGQAAHFSPRRTKRGDESGEKQKMVYLIAKRLFCQN